VICLDEMGPESAKSFPGQRLVRSAPNGEWRGRARQEIDDVLLWALVHPRWEFVFQPRYAAYLNLIEPWWKVLRSLALTGRRFETWEQLCAAVDSATQYWNAHRHPFVWGRRKRRCSARPSGIARLPIAA
jgi:hypothetical protein